MSERMRHRILILKPSSLGDIVQTLPALAALRQGLPKANLSWLVNAEWAAVLDNNPLLDQVRIFPRREFRGFAGGLAFAGWLRREPRTWTLDAVVDFQGLLRSGLIARATGAEQIFGLGDSREGARFFHTEIVPTAGIMHSVERYLQLAKAVGAADGPVEFPLGLGDAIPDFKASDGSFLVLHPFSRGAGKSLSPEDVGIFCRTVHPQTVVIVGRGRVPDANWPENAIDLLDVTTIPQLIWLLRRAGGTVSVDSGPMHLAAATGRPLIGIHAWTDPRKVGPYRPDAIVWKGAKMCRFDELAEQSPSFFLKCELPCPDDLAAIAKRAAAWLNSA